jgi:phosphatidylinositol 4-phosphatase
MRRSPSTKLSGFGSRTKRSIFLNPASFNETSPIAATTATATTTAKKAIRYPRVQRTTDGIAFQTHNATIQISVLNGRLEATPIGSKLGDDAWIPVDGIYGVIPIPSGFLWVLLTSSETVYTGPPWGEIKKVKSLEVVHLSHNNIHLSQRQIKEETRQLRLLRQAFKDHVFYFTRSDHNIDMTQTLQRCFANTINETQPDSRFFWNEPFLPLLHKSLRNLVLPVTSAFVGLQANISIPNGQYDELLISRRSRFRAGTRFTKRGADALGHVANYAETEQVCIFNNSQVMAHVQTRGSIPLRWSSPADVKTYAPKVRIGTDPLAQARSMMRHIRSELGYYASHGCELSRKYAQLVFVNLIDKHKDQGRLGRAFDAVLQALLDVHSNGNSTIPVQHIWFDFHAQVKHGKWDKLVSLLQQVTGTLEEHGYFSASIDGTAVRSHQRGIIRTNCMDCLDRTNVVQSIFGRYMLFRALQGTKQLVIPVAFSAAFRKNPMVLPWGEVSHRLLWADNADAISRLYAGTPALKGDFTRTGKRTKRGALDDGMNSLQRYYLNNFLDADRQEGMDLLVGHTDFGSDVAEEEQQWLATDASLSDAARSLLNYDTGSDGEDEEGDFSPHHQRKSLSSRLKRLGGGAIPKPALDLRWLPGDLQNHMKSNPSSDALEALDRRSATDQPWWVTAAENDSEDVDELNHNLATSSVNAGHIIGGLIAATQAPIATAVAVVCMLGLSALDKQ